MIAYVDPKMRARFLAKTRRNGDCWEWTGGRFYKGYGSFWIGYRQDGTSWQMGAHRFAYQLFVGPIPEGLVLDHLCRNPACVNAAHLEPVTHRENILRGTSTAAERARQTHCPQGHSDYRIRRGRRECRICARYSSNEMRKVRRRRQRAREQAAVLGLPVEAEVAVELGGTVPADATRGGSTSASASTATETA